MDVIGLAVTGRSAPCDPLLSTDQRIFLAGRALAELTKYGMAGRSTSALADLIDARSGVGFETALVVAHANRML